MSGCQARSGNVQVQICQSCERMCIKLPRDSWLTLVEGSPAAVENSICCCNWLYVWISSSVFFFISGCWIFMTQPCQINPAVQLSTDGRMTQAEGSKVAMTIGSKKIP